jgi:cardiolipin synthase A/B
MPDSRALRPGRDVAALAGSTPGRTRGSFAGMRMAERVPEASVRVLDGGAEAYPAMLRAIAGARREVFLEVYQFSPEGIGARFVGELSAAARRGVRVEVILDGLGSAPGATEVADTLEAAGCDVRIWGRLLLLLAGRFRRNHRKILAVDGEVAFVGGLNIADEYGLPVPPPDERPWADLALELRGPVAAWLQQRARRERGRSPPGPARIWLSGVGGGRRLRRRYLKSFGGARRTLDVAHAYFLPDRGLVRSMTAAARRGVEVRLVVAGASDVALLGPAMRHLYRKLLRAGVRISEWSRSVLHAKAAAVDGARLLVGSFNLEPLSLANLEALAEVEDAAAVAAGARWIRSRFDEGEEITLDRIGRGSFLERLLVDRLGALVVNGLRRLARLISRS